MIASTPDRTPESKKINRQMIGYAGAAALFLGVFMPIVTVPIVGAVNYFQNGRGDGAIVMAFALVAVVFLVRRAYLMLWLPGLGSLAVLLYTFVNLQSRLSTVEAEMAYELADNPFRGLTEAMVGTVQLQWGWAVLVVGSVLLLVAAFAGESWPTAVFRMDPKRVRRVCLGVLIAAAIATFAFLAPRTIGRLQHLFATLRDQRATQERLAAVDANLAGLPRESWPPESWRLHGITGREESMREPTEQERKIVDAALGPERLKSCGGPYRVERGGSHLLVRCPESAVGLAGLEELHGYGVITDKEFQELEHRALEGSGTGVVREYLLKTEEALVADWRINTGPTN